MQYPQRRGGCPTTTKGSQKMKTEQLLHLTLLYKPKATLDMELKRQRNWTKKVTKKKSEGVGALPW